MAASAIIILGAQSFPKLPNAGASPAFASSAKRVGSLLSSALNTADGAMLDLFDSEKNASDQLNAIQDFLEAHREKIQNLFLFYVGHGGFVTAGQEYFLALRSTRAGNESGTGLMVKSLAHVLRENFRAGRTFIILDCCFAGAALASLQGPQESLLEANVHEVLPSTGTALLVASSKNKAALAPKGLELTMFSCCLVDALERGDPALPAMLSLGDVHDITTRRMKERFAEQAVRPELHSPRQEKGDVGRLRLIPNPASSTNASEPVHYQPAAEPRAHSNAVADPRQSTTRAPLHLALLRWHWRQIVAQGGTLSHTMLFVFLSVVLMVASFAIGLAEARPIYANRHVSYSNAVSWMLASMTVMPASIYMFAEAARVADRSVLDHDAFRLWADERDRLARWWLLFGVLGVMGLVGAWAVNSGLPLLGWTRPDAIDWNVAYLNEAPDMRFVNGAFSLAAHLTMALFLVLFLSFVLFAISLAQTLRQTPPKSGEARRGVAREMLGRVMFAGGSLLALCSLVRIWQSFLHDPSIPPSQSILPFLLEMRDPLYLRFVNVASIVAVLAALVVTCSCLALVLAVEYHTGEWPFPRMSKNYGYALAGVGVLSVLLYWVGAVVCFAVLGALIIRAAVRITFRQPAWWLVSLIAALTAMALVVIGAYVGVVGRIAIVIGVFVFVLLQVFRWERRYFRLGAVTLGAIAAWHTLPRLSIGFAVKGKLGSAWGHLLSEPPSGILTAIFLGISSLLLAFDLRINQIAHDGGNGAASQVFRPGAIAAFGRRRTDIILAIVVFGPLAIGAFLPWTGLYPGVATLIYAMYFVSRLFLWVEPSEALPQNMERLRSVVKLRALPSLRWMTWGVALAVPVAWLYTRTITSVPAPEVLGELLGIRVSESPRGLQCIEKRPDGCFKYRCTMGRLLAESAELTEGARKEVPLTLALPRGYHGVQVELFGPVKVRGGNATSYHQDVVVRLRTDHGECFRDDLPTTNRKCIATLKGQGPIPLALEGLARANTRGGPIVFSVEVPRCRRGGEEAICTFDDVQVHVTPW